MLLCYVALGSFMMNRGPFFREATCEFSKLPYQICPLVSPW